MHRPGTDACSLGERESTATMGTKARYIRPRTIRRPLDSESVRGTPFTRKPPLSVLVVLVILSVSIENLPLPALAFQNNNINNNANRIRTIRANAWNVASYTRTAIPFTTTTTTRNKSFSLGTRIPRHCTTIAAMSKGDVENSDDNNNNDDETDELFLDDLLLTNDAFDDDEGIFVDEHEYDDEEDDSEYLKRELARLESMENMLKDIEEYCMLEGNCEDDPEGDGDDDADDEMIFMGDVDDLEGMESLFDFLEENDNDDDDNDDDEFFAGMDDDEEPNDDRKPDATADKKTAPQNQDNNPMFSPQGLEEALLQGVVPVDAGVGSNTLPGDFDFDPLGLADKDYVKEFQYKLLNWLPGGNPNNDPPPDPRPTALVLRDYREAEIRHGRLAMLAVIIWPIQEKLDNLLLGADRSGPLLYGPVTLPYFPLVMTLLMMLLGYLDIYTKDIQEEEGVGDAFLPGDCLWDPLRILDGAPPAMKRNMQERELFNGRVAMLAFAAFVFEEATSHQAIVDIPNNDFLFVPAYQIPVVQEWLDSQFLTYDN